jgi:hypothetical protein
MLNCRDRSPWWSLAVAFGGGLAFGLGMRLAQKAMRPIEAVSPRPADACCGEHRAHVEGRLAELELAAARLNRDISGLIDQTAAAHRTLVESLPAVVSGQVAFQMEGCANALQDSVTARLAEAVEERLARVHEELESRKRELGDIRQKTDAADSRISGFFAGMGQVCRQVSEDIPPAAPDRGALTDSGDPGTPLPENKQDNDGVGIRRVSAAV